MQVGLAALLLTGCPTDDDTEDTDLPDPAVGPELTHEPPASVDEGVAIPVSVTAVDVDGVDQVKVFYRTQGVTAWDTLFLERSADDAEVWTAEIPAQTVQWPAIEYYVRAQDATDLHSVSYLPVEASSGPFSVPVIVVGRPLPFEEPFEDSGSAGLYGLGWDEDSNGFRGYAWEISSTKAYTGAASAGHRRGIEGVDPLEDWLISPALDFSTLDRIEVGWFEYGDYAANADHSLWISTTGPDPDLGTFELVTELGSPPEDAWGKSRTIDLTAWAGNETVWLAWHYQGQFSDAWYIDDVSVRALGPDLTATGFSWDPVDPGGSTTLTLSVENLVDAASGPITVDWTVDPAYGTVTTPVEVGAIDALGTADWVTTLVVDAATPDNSYIPVIIDATDGERSWTWTEKVVVGVPSAATVAIDQTTKALVSLSLGVGDPDAPDIEIPVVSEVKDVGAWTWTVDLTDQWAWLPPAAGDLRWWVRVDAAGAGSVTEFTIDWDATTYTSDDLGAYEMDVEGIFYLPRPPAPAIVGSSTLPSPVAPGDVVDWTVTLQNLGADTSGAATVTLSSSDPDVTVLSTAPVELDGTSWLESTSTAVPLQFQVSDTHVDSSPVELDLTVTDEVESFLVSSTVAVPWPVLAVTGVVIDDWASGDNDGLLDPSETANLEVSLSNLGGMSAFGAVSCTIEQAGGTASSTVLTASGAFGLMSIGATKSEDDFKVEVTAGALGDTLEMRLSCTDGVETYTPTFELVLGEPPWLNLKTVNDDCGDAVGSYDFDMKNGQYRSDGTTLEIRLESCTPFDETKLFIESWFDTLGTYQLYQLVLQSGTAKLRGYKFGVFTTVSYPTISYPDAYTVQFTIDLPSMGLTIDRIGAGFAAGFCGGDSYYCDHFPDGWGDPYQNGFNTDVFAQMSW